MQGEGAGAMCDHLKLEVRTRVRAHPNLDVRGVCVQPKKRLQLTPCQFYTYKIRFFFRIFTTFKQMLSRFYPSFF